MGRAGLVEGAASESPGTHFLSVQGCLVLGILKPLPSRTRAQHPQFVHLPHQDVLGLAVCGLWDPEQACPTPYSSVLPILLSLG